MTLKIRIDLLFGLLLLVGLAADIGRMTYAARLRAQTESDAMLRMSRDFAASALVNLRDAPDPEARLRELAARLNGLRHVRVALAADGQAAAAAQLAPDATRLEAPLWFYNLIGARGAAAVLPVVIEGRKRGDLVISGDPADEVNEVWQDVRSLALTGGALVLAALAGASFILGRTLRPLSDYGRALSRLREGDYAVRATPQGSPEFIDLCDNLNALAQALQKLVADNRALIGKLMQAQDDERKAIAHDLHDEIGPHLFALRAQASLLRAALPQESGPARHAEAICAQIETLQGENRRILRRLRPAALDELGLAPALRALADDWREAQPDIALELETSGDLAALSPDQSLALYRVAQEALTNLYRHAHATHARVRVASDRREARALIEDDGAGFGAEDMPGLGLAGMRQRLAALGGTLVLGASPEGGGRVEAILPL